MKTKYINKTIELLNKTEIKSSARSSYNVVGAKADCDKTIIVFSVEDKNNDKLIFNIDLEDKAIIHTELYQVQKGLGDLEELIVISTSIKKQVDDIMRDIIKGKGIK